LGRYPKRALLWVAAFYFICIEIVVGFQNGLEHLAEDQTGREKQTIIMG
jgi:hypothetical protein